MSSSSPFDRALSTLSSTAHSIFDTPVHRHSLPLASAGALSIIAFSYFWPNYPRSKENKSLPLLRKAPKGLKDDDIYPENIYEGSQYVDTPYGQVKTFQVGPTDGKKLLLVHGISTPAPIWKNVLGNLTKAGYRVLVYDLYGRGYSDSPSVPHDVALYTAQISFLLTANPDWEKFDICGMSLGGPIVCNFAHYFPQRIRKIFLICPAGGIPHNSVPIKTQIFSSLPFGLMQSLISISPINPVKDSKSIGAFQAKNHPGFFYSFLSSLSFGPIFGQASVMKEVCQNFGDKIQIVWGDKDDVVPLETKEYFAGNTKVNIIPGGGHWILATHGEDVSKYLIAHLDS